MPKQPLREIIKSEYKKCAKSPVHFMRKYCMIQHPIKGKIPFNLYPFQSDTLESIQHNQYSIILKSRQLGISTLMAGYILWCMNFREDFSALVIATGQDVAKNLVTKVRVMYDNLPSWLATPHEEHNKLSLRLKNGSQVKATSSTGTSGRSEANSMLVLDEAAFIRNIGDLWASAQQTLSTGGQCVALSTPNGTGNWFHKTWVDAIAGGEFNPIKLHWTVHPDRDQTWRDKQTELLGERLAAQECDTDFISSGHTVVDGPILQWYQNNQITDPIERRGIDGNYWLWQHPDYTKKYAVVADVARGDGSDFSTFHVVDIELMEQVAEYKGKIGTTEFGNMLVSVATDWNEALLVIENNNIGWAVVQVAIDRGYKNLFYTYRNEVYVDEDVHLRKNYDLKDKSKKVPGFSLTSRNRPMIISKLETYFRDKVPIIHSQRLLDELLVFIWINSKPQAQLGYNDDLVIPFSVALWVRDTSLRLFQQGIDLSRQSLEHLGSHRGVYTNNEKENNSWKWNPGTGQTDLSWLL